MGYQNRENLKIHMRVICTITLEFLGEVIIIISNYNFAKLN